MVLSTARPRQGHVHVTSRISSGHPSIASPRLPATPVLVTPANVSLKREFICKLCDELVRANELAGAEAVSWETPLIQIDWVRDGGIWSVLSDPVARMWTQRVAGAISSRCGVPARFQVTTTIGRPVSQTPELLFGICDTRVPLSPWTYPIHLSVSRMPAPALQ